MKGLAAKNRMKVLLFPAALLLLLFLWVALRLSGVVDKSVDMLTNSGHRVTIHAGILAEESPVLEEMPLPEGLHSVSDGLQREARLRALLSTMTLEEKVGQLFFVGSNGGSMEEQVTKYHLGGVLLFTRDYRDASGDRWLTRDQFRSKLESLQAASVEDTGLPLFIGSDEEGGTVTRASRNPNLFDSRFRSPRQIWAQSGGSSDAFAEDAWEKSSALMELGVNVNFAPVCDVSTDPSDFIYDRSLGQDAAATAEFVARTVTAMGEAGMRAVLKHFPGYGNNEDTHAGAATDRRSMETFESVDFVPFRAGIAAGKTLMPFVLVNHNTVQCMDANMPASLSPAVHAVLRQKLGFEGVVLTDDLAMNAVKAYAAEGQAVVLALLAGNDMILTTDFRSQIQDVLDALADGRLSEDTINTACLRVLRAKEEQFHFLSADTNSDAARP